MLAETMMPEAFEHGGRVVGIATTLGFAIAWPIGRMPSPSLIVLMAASFFASITVIVPPVSEGT